MRRADLTGARFGRLIAIQLVDHPGGDARWLFRCDCGSEKALLAKKVKDGSTKSCGCLRRENAPPTPTFKHGSTIGGPSKLYMVWQTMKQRCHNPRNENYRRYGGVGVNVCSDWQDFAPFRTWAVTHGYAEGLEIDRLDPAGDYSPANCRWITPEANRARARPWGSVSRSATRKERTSFPARSPNGTFSKR